MKKQISLNGKILSYLITGEGHPVVLLHGFGEDSSVWDNQIEALKEFQLIIPELPGTGDSEMTEDMSMEGMAGTINGLLEELKIERCSMIGHSMGGYVTLAFAEQYMEKLGGFGLFHSTAYADTEEKKQTRRKGIDFVKKHGAFEFLKTSIPNLYSEATRKGRPRLVEDQIAASHNFSGAALVSYYESMIKRPSRVNILKNSHVPVLFVLGKYDAAVPLKDGLEQCYLPGLSYIHVLDKSAHMGLIEEREQANSILLNYLLSIHHQTR
jgi:pimeloyl-ACP methyl ester carboxylesterase